MTGVTGTRVGYIGGTTENPTYNSVCKGDGHTEALEVTYDPSQVSYEDLLETFFNEHDPQRRLPTQYRSAIFPTTEKQAQLAQEVVAKKVENLPMKFVATDIEKPAQKFWEAEMYHQNYNRTQKFRFAGLALVILLGMLDQRTPYVSLAMQALQISLVLSLVPQLVEPVIQQIRGK